MMQNAFLGLAAMLASASSFADECNFEMNINQNAELLRIARPGQDELGQDAWMEALSSSCIFGKVLQTFDAPCEIAHYELLGVDSIAKVELSQKKTGVFVVRVGTKLDRWEGFNMRFEFSAKEEALARYVYGELLSGKAGLMLDRCVGMTEEAVLRNEQGAIDLTSNFFIGE